MKKIWYDDAWDHYLEWQKVDKKNFKRINTLIKEIDRQGHVGSGEPEPLKHELSGWWSRRIDKQHRLVYRIVDEEIEIVQCKGHY